MMYTEQMTNKLNDLLTKNYDAEAGYKKAAELSENPKLKQFYENQAQNRYDFGHELKTEIRNTGGTPDKGTSFKGDAHRAWMGMKDTFASNKEENILEEVVKGEKATIEEYREIVNDTTLPPTTHKVIANQINSIQKAITLAKNFELAYA